MQPSPAEPGFVERRVATAAHLDAEPCGDLRQTLRERRFSASGTPDSPSASIRGAIFRYTSRKLSRQRRVDPSSVRANVSK